MIRAILLSRAWRRTMIALIAVSLGFLLVLALLVLGADLANRAGLWPIEPTVDGRTVLMRGGWVPVASPDRALPPFKEFRGVTYLRVYGLLWGTADTLVISSFPKINEHDMARAEKVRAYDWGRAYILPARADSPGEHHVILDSHRLLATTKDLERIESISAIR
jgi:hypothetical protein